MVQVNVIRSVIRVLGGMRVFARLPTSLTFEILQNEAKPASVRVASALCV